MIVVKGMMPSPDGSHSSPYEINFTSPEAAMTCIRDIAKAVTTSGAHMAVIQVEDRILAAMLRACGGTLVIDAHDLMSTDPIPNVTCFEKQDPWCLVYRLDENTPG